MDTEQMLASLVRVGTVTAVDKKGKKARVVFMDTDITSGWLCVLQHHGADLFLEPDGAHTHTINDTYTGGGSASTEPVHSHPQSYVTNWMPKVNDMVVTLYLPVFNGDGFILGGI